MKRFYKLVSHRKEEGGYAILLDGRPVKTPSKNPLLAPTEKLANEIMKEWAAQGDKVAPETMPLTQILNTRIDRIPGQRKILEEEILKFFNTDLLCYRAAEPPAMAARQAELWNPWLDWFEKKFGVRLGITTGLSALKQPEEAHEKIKQCVSSLRGAAGAAAISDEAFTILQLVTPLCGSVILALAFVEGEASPEEVLKAAFAEEDLRSELYNEDKYGRDPLTEKKRRAAERDLAAAFVYLNSL